MPELPEVEVTRRSFAPRIAGATVQAVRLGAPLRWPLGCAESALIGTTIGAVVRRGKYLWLPLSRAGALSGGLLLHLGMSGSLAFHSDRAPAGKHDHFDLETTQGVLRLTDPRRFGAVVWAPALDQGLAGKLLGRLGYEPFDPRLTVEVFHAGIKRRHCAVKSVLLAGELIVGAGNIYACEALFAAGIDPRIRGDRLSKARCERLLAALRQTLARAMEVGGSTLRNFRDAHGQAGAFQVEALVYGREGLPCTVCAAPVRRLVTAQRSTYYCPRCQRR